MKNGLIINEKGEERYYLNNKLHRLDGPAVKCANGYECWFKDGKIFRLNGPARTELHYHFKFYIKEWIIDNKRHREDGPSIEYEDGSKFWYINNKLHKLTDPAIEYANGDKFWYIDGEHHRINGPASEFTEGNKEWWWQNKQYSEKEYDKLIKLKGFL